MPIGAKQNKYCRAAKKASARRIDERYAISRLHSRLSRAKALLSKTLATRFDMAHYAEDRELCACCGFRSILASYAAERLRRCAAPYY